MSWLSETFRLTTTKGQSTTVGDLTVTPEARALAVRLPFAGFVWNWPGAVRVERGDQVERLRIVDVSRVVQLGLLAATLFLMLFGRARDARRKGKRDD